MGISTRRLSTTSHMANYFLSGFKSAHMRLEVAACSIDRQICSAISTRRQSTRSQLATLLRCPQVIICPFSAQVVRGSSGAAFGALAGESIGSDRKNVVEKMSLLENNEGSRWMAELLQFECSGQGAAAGK